MLNIVKNRLFIRQGGDGENSKAREPVLTLVAITKYHRLISILFGKFEFPNYGIMISCLSNRNLFLTVVEARKFWYGQFLMRTALLVCR